MTANTLQQNVASAGSLPNKTSRMTANGEILAAVDANENQLQWFRMQLDQVRHRSWEVEIKSSNLSLTSYRGHSSCCALVPARLSQTESAATIDLKRNNDQTNCVLSEIVLDSNRIQRCAFRDCTLQQNKIWAQCICGSVSTKSKILATDLSTMPIQPIVNTHSHLQLCE